MECAWRKKCSVEVKRTLITQSKGSFVKKFYSFTRKFAPMRKLCRLWKDVECCKWKIPIVFLRIKIVNISPATRDLRSSTACSVTAPCTAWSTAPGIPGISRKMADGSRTAQAAPSHMIRSIMIRSCRFCGGHNTFFWKINTFFAHFF